MVPVTAKRLHQHLLSIRTGDCKPIVPTSVEQSCHCFFLSFWLTLMKFLPVFCVDTSIIINYFNSGYRLSKLQDYWLIIILKVRIFIIHALPTFVTFQKFNQIKLNKFVSLRLGLNQKHKNTSLSFQDTLNPFCDCDCEIETTAHFLLHYPQFSTERRTLLNKIKSIDTSLLNQKHLFLEILLIVQQSTR